MQSALQFFHFAPWQEIAAGSSLIHALEMFYMHLQIFCQIGQPQREMVQWYSH